MTGKRRFQSCFSQAFQAVLAISLVFCLLAPSHVLAQGDPIVNYRKDDRAMSQAVSAANRSLPRFERLFQGQEAERFEVKVRIPHANGNEVIWMNVDSINGDSISGRIANNPVHLPDLQKGSPYTSSRRQIADWGYTRDGKLYGHYTTRVMLPSVPQDVREYLRRVLSPEP
jgi:uncharacterized protein YegJ (DUF2314 family)